MEEDAVENQEKKEKTARRWPRAGSVSCAVGERFGMLVVIGDAEPAASGSRRYRCRCDCGGKTIAVASNLRRGIWNSCGCRKRAAARENGRHNMTGARMVTFQGETLPLSAWAARLGTHKRILKARLMANWDLERALTEPVRERRKEKD